MNDKKITLIMIKRQCQEALRLKKKNVCEITLYSGETEFLINLLNELIEKEQ